MERIKSANTTETKSPVELFLLKYKGHKPSYETFVLHHQQLIQQGRSKTIGETEALWKSKFVKCASALNIKIKIGKPDFSFLKNQTKYSSSIRTESSSSNSRVNIAFKDKETTLTQFSPTIINTDIHKLIIDEQNFYQLVNSFTTYAYTYLTKGENVININTDIYKYLALSNIIVIHKNIWQTKDYLESITQNVLKQLYKIIRYDVFKPKRLNNDVFEKIQKVFEDQEKDEDDKKFIDSMRDIANEANDLILMRVAEAIILILNNCSIDEFISSEMHVQSSFIHNIMNSLFKVNRHYTPYCSNSGYNEDASSVRPDYKIRVLDDLLDAYCNFYGEVKPNSKNTDLLTLDKYRLCLFSKLAIEEKKCKNIMSFQAVAREIEFYMMFKLGGIYPFAEIEKITIPTTYDTFKSLLDHVSSLYNVAYLYEKHCKKSPKPILIQVTPTLPYQIVKNVVMCRETAKSNEDTTTNSNEDEETNEDSNLYGMGLMLDLEADTVVIEDGACADEQNTQAGIDQVFDCD